MASISLLELNELFQDYEGETPHEDATLTDPEPITTRTLEPHPSVGGRHLTVWSLAALAAGLGLGIAFHGSEAPEVATLAAALKSVGRVWIVALQITVVPLVLSHAVLAVLRTERLGSLGAKTLVLFLAMLVVAAAFTLLVAPVVIALYRVDPATVAALRSAVTVPEWLRSALTGETALGDWFRGYVPASVIRVFQGGNLLLLLLGAMLLALAARGVAGRHRESLTRRTQVLADAALRVVGWILRFTPVGVFALSFGLALGAGVNAAGLLTFYILVVSGTMLAFTGLLYPLTALLSGLPMRRFAHAVAPAQVVALSTRSSLVSLPALIEGARDRLGLPVSATGFVLPLAVSTFKLSMAISHPIMLLFVAHLFGVPLGPGQIAVFVGTIFLMSFTVPGIPGGAPGVGTLPAFLAAGVPLEGVLILDAVEAIPDIFKTITNVTADMSAAAIVTRRSTSDPPGAA